MKTKKTTTAQPKLITERFFNGRQSVNLIATYEYKGEKLRIAIKRDSYDTQSSASIKIWNASNKEWNFIERIPYKLMDVCVQKVFCQRDAEELTFYEKAAFGSDVNTLLNLAMEII